MTVEASDKATVTNSSLTPSNTNNSAVVVKGKDATLDKVNISVTPGTNASVSVIADGGNATVTDSSSTGASNLTVTGNNVDLTNSTLKGDDKGGAVVTAKDGILTINATTVANYTPTTVTADKGDVNVTDSNISSPEINLTATNGSVVISKSNLVDPNADKATNSTVTLNAKDAIVVDRSNISTSAVDVDTDASIVVNASNLTSNTNISLVSTNNEVNVTGSNLNSPDTTISAPNAAVTISNANFSGEKVNITSPNVAIDLSNFTPTDLVISVPNVTEAEGQETPVQGNVSLTNVSITTPNGNVEVYNPNGSISITDTNISTTNGNTNITGNTITLTGNQISGNNQTVLYNESIVYQDQGNVFTNSTTTPGHTYICRVGDRVCLGLEEAREEPRRGRGGDNRRGIGNYHPTTERDAGRDIGRDSARDTISVSEPRREELRRWFDRDNRGEDRELNAQDINVLSQAGVFNLSTCNVVVDQILIDYTPENILEHEDEVKARLAELGINPQDFTRFIQACTRYSWLNFEEVRR
ncbi:hypothetical protein CJP74_05665 [Psittacicella melopsittaci]|uniref:Uncharacterized protein n=1 Tax=Psittacicella melopsittaci TaxID=2028576 RepID=A0A3A1Y7C2_9GAMM|nr:hypothetical protein [Psittacicella melopsittaci]RIY32027.1 hypothetical protein CJP74_05665 [Psittacicella melopsittaci]